MALEACHAIGNLDYRLFPIVNLILDEHSPLGDGDDIVNADSERHLGRSLSGIITIMNNGMLKVQSERRTAS